MAMTINTNINSLNAQRNAQATQMSLSTSIQRLSSGLRVNSAKDDAAGLAIATRMDSQARGMTVAIRNANDGISMLQTAESGMQTVSDMLQRMRELAVQATNSTNTSSDVASLNQEYTQLAAEIGRTISAVQFNGTSILTTTGSYDFQVGANSGQTITVASGTLNMDQAGNVSATYGAGAASSLSTAAGTNSANAANIDAIDKALQTISDSRAQLGAAQSRFQNTINFLQTAVENQTAAKGRIMDADFATETANLSRSQILQQAGTAMIAQANQLPQQVLSLLKG
ncbi:flagellin [Curvibacter sp. RS43]|uniref:Flagellin n=1 Tax=Curvibacter microcysteis TaxID=3026419 RepID=A0ABT5ML36_9BURK|nr:MULTISPECIES: flagellin [unclassified Curvibacter]MDD0811822.1 flagellin [Curvibacter sp. RS43]MDD0816587.1 flagellin [Curvibacter sp. HBC28]